MRLVSLEQLSQMKVFSSPAVAIPEFAMRRRRRAGRFTMQARPPKQGARYFDEADVSKGVQQLWGQSKKKDVISEACGALAFCCPLCESLSTLIAEGGG